MRVGEKKRKTRRDAPRRITARRIKGAGGREGKRERRDAGYGRDGYWRECNAPYSLSYDTAKLKLRG